MDPGKVRLQTRLRIHLRKTDTETTTNGKNESPLCPTFPPSTVGYQTLSRFFYLSHLFNHLPLQLFHTLSLPSFLPPSSNNQNQNHNQNQPLPHPHHTPPSSAIQTNHHTLPEPIHTTSPNTPAQTPLPYPVLHLSQHNHVRTRHTHCQNGRVQIDTAPRLHTFGGTYHPNVALQNHTIDVPWLCRNVVRIGRKRVRSSGSGGFGTSQGGRDRDED